MEAAESKGSGFIAAVTTLRKLVPAEEIDRILPSLPPETADLVRRPPLPVAWISSGHFRVVVRVVAQQIFAGDEKKVEEWGRAAMLYDLRGIYKMFVRFMSAQFVIDRAAKLWDTYSRNQGTLRARAISASSAEVVYDRLPTDLVGPEFWAYQRGVIKGALEATGYKHAIVETIEGGGTAGHARFAVSWS